MKTGLFGGSFDPVHMGHVRLVRTVRKAFGLDDLIVVPSADPPHKDASHMADPADRLEMTRLAFAKEPGCVISDVEIKRGGRSYTIDTVVHFLNTRPEDTQLFLIMGLDSFLELNTWKNYKKIVETVPLIVINRASDTPGVLPEKTSRPITLFCEALAANLSPKYFYNEKSGCYEHDALCPVCFFEFFSEPISATHIRQQIGATGLAPEDVLTPAVAQFIKQKDLYKCPTA